MHFFNLLGLLCLPSLVTHARPLNSPLLSSYDYIVVGGGASGLTVANRLSEDPSVTVLVIEAGNADNYEENIMVPIFVGSELVSQYNWGITTVAQTYLDGASRWIPQGKALGGGTILNALLWNRGNAGDYDSWVTLGNPGWGWHDLLPYFMKSETYSPFNSDGAANPYGIFDTPDIHGYSGPVSVAFQRYFYNVSIQWYEALQALGIPAVEPNDGRQSGAMFLPMDLNAANMSRADARRSYYDPFSARDNFYVSTGQHVLKVIFSNFTCRGDANSPNVRATGVEYAATDGDKISTVYATREVILAAGSLHTPQILELSGIGMQSVMNEFGIHQLLNLDGVGNNLQDHFQAGLWSYLYNTSYVYPTEFNNNASLMEDAKNQYYTDRTGPWTAGPPNGVAFPSLSQISDMVDEIAASASAQSRGQYLEEGLDSSIIAGYEAMKPLLITALRDKDRSVIEILNNNAGGMTMSNMRPFTRGHSHIGSTNPFDPPVVDPRYGSNPVDIDVLVESVYFNRKIFATPPMEVFDAWQAGPTLDANETAVRAYIAANGGTEYHVSGTCAMLPKELGGVVSSDLLVYGTSNLRIVDASIYPILPASHLQAVVYAVAEKAADIIKAAGTPPRDPMKPVTCSTVTGSAVPPYSRHSSIPNVPSSTIRGHSTHSYGNHTSIAYPSKSRPVSATPYTTASYANSSLDHSPSTSGQTSHHDRTIPHRTPRILPVPPMHTRPIPFPGAYPDTHPFDHPWDPEPVWNPKAIDHLIPTKVFGPAPSFMSPYSAAWPVYGQDLSKTIPEYAITSAAALPQPTKTLVATSRPSAGFETVVKTATVGTTTIVVNETPVVAATSLGRSSSAAGSS